MSEFLTKHTIEINEQEALSLYVVLRSLEPFNSEAMFSIYKKIENIVYRCYSVNELESLLNEKHSKDGYEKE